MSALTSLLVRDDVVSVRQIEESLQRQVLDGGELDTALLELTNTAENTLIAYRAASVRALPARRDDVMSASATTLSLLDAELAQAFQVTPISHDALTLVVASANPLVETQTAELSARVGLRIEWRITSELRVQAAHARYYDVQISQRFVNLLARIEVRDAGELPTVEPLQVTPMAALSGELLRGFDDSVDFESQLEAAFDRVSMAPLPMVSMVPPNDRDSTQPTAAPMAWRPSAVPPAARGVVDRALAARPNPQQRVPVAEAPNYAVGEPTTGSLAGPPGPRKRVPTLRRQGRIPQGPLTVAMAEDALAAAEERDAVVEVFFRFSRQYFDTTVLFSVRDDRALGMDAHNASALVDVRELSVAILRGSAVEDMVRSLLPRVIDLSRKDEDRVLALVIKRLSDQPCALIPVCVKRRVVSFIYGDRAGERLTLDDIAPLLSLLPHVSGAFERIIRTRKAIGSHMQREQAEPRDPELQHAPTQRSFSMPQTRPLVQHAPSTQLEISPSSGLALVEARTRRALDALGVPGPAPPPPSEPPDAPTGLGVPHVELDDERSFAETSETARLGMRPLSFGNRASNSPPRYFSKPPPGTGRYSSMAPGPIDPRNETPKPRPARKSPRPMRRSSPGQETQPLRRSRQALQRLAGQGRNASPAPPPGREPDVASTRNASSAPARGPGIASPRPRAGGVGEARNPSGGGPGGELAAGEARNPSGGGPGGELAAGEARNPSGGGPGGELAAGEARNPSGGGPGGELSSRDAARNPSLAPPRDGAYGSARNPSFVPPRDGSFGEARTASPVPPHDGTYGSARHPSAAPPRDGAYGSTRSPSVAPPHDGAYGSARSPSVAPPRDSSYGSARNPSVAPPRDGAYGSARSPSVAPPRTPSVIPARSPSLAPGSGHIPATRSSIPPSKPAPGTGTYRSQGLTTELISMPTDTETAVAAETRRSQQPPPLEQDERDELDDMLEADAYQRAPANDRNPTPAFETLTEPNDGLEPDDHQRDKAKALVAELCSGRVDADEPVVQQLRALGTAALDALFDEFPGPLWFDRRRPHARIPLARDIGPVCRALDAFGEDAADGLAELLRAQDVETRYYATLFASERVYPELLDPLLEQLFDDDAQIRLLVRDALPHYRRAPGFARMVERLRMQAAASESPLRARIAAIDAITVLRDAGSVETLIDLVSHVDKQISVPAHRALLGITCQDFGKSVKKWRAWHADNRRRHRVEWLIEGLMHSEQTLRASAGVELQKVTQVYYGYVAAAPKRDREQAQKRYQAWWQNEGQKKL